LILININLNKLFLVAFVCFDISFAPLYSLIPLSSDFACDSGSFLLVLQLPASRLHLIITNAVLTITIESCQRFANLSSIRRHSHSFTHFKFINLLQASSGSPFFVKPTLLLLSSSSCLPNNRFAAIFIQFAFFLFAVSESICIILSSASLFIRQYLPSSSSVPLARIRSDRNLQEYDESLVLLPPLHCITPNVSIKLNVKRTRTSLFCAQIRI
jgi:hypothetical protein